MGEAARFIISLDCEGKWGMADHLQTYHHELLTDAALTRAYERLVALFARYDVPATFGFVMAFILSPDERERFRAELLGDERDAWLRPYHEDLAAGRRQGWHVPEALDIVRAASIHEVACHSFCHRPLGDQSISAAGAARELSAAHEVARIKGLSLETFIFPRNEVGHLTELKASGFLGYRERLQRPRGKLGRALSLAEELNILARAQRRSPDRDGLVPIPSGRLLNWRFGARAWIPAALTRARWLHQLRSASAGDVVHLWLHPHNLITAPDTEPLLEAVLADVAAMCDAGRIRVVTQRDYCREVLQGGRAHAINP